jgi:hypothetical protein
MHRGGHFLTEDEEFLSELEAVSLVVDEFLSEGGALLSGASVFLFGEELGVCRRRVTSR